MKLLPDCPRFTLPKPLLGADAKYIMQQLWDASRHFVGLSSFFHQPTTVWFPRDTFHYIHQIPFQSPGHPDRPLAQAAIEISSYFKAFAMKEGLAGLGKNGSDIVLMFESSDRNMQRPDSIYWVFGETKLLYPYSVLVLEVE